MELRLKEILKEKGVPSVCLSPSCSSLNPRTLCAVLIVGVSCTLTNRVAMPR